MVKDTMVHYEQHSNLGRVAVRLIGVLMCRGDPLDRPNVLQNAACLGNPLGRPYEPIFGFWLIEED